MRWSLLLVCALLVAPACKKKRATTGPAQPVEEPAKVPTPDDAPDVATGDESVEPAPVVVTAEERVDRAVAMLTTGSELDTKRARELLEEVVDEEPDMAVAHLNIGVASYRLGDLERAASSFSRVTRIDASNAKAWLYLGEVELQLGEADTALRRFRAGLAQDGEDMDLRVALVRTLREMGDYQAAVDAAVEALQVNARSLPIYNEMGLAHVGLGELDLARFVFEKAEAIPGAEQNATIQAYLGWTLYQKGEKYAAAYRLKKAVELDPGFVPGLVYLSRVHMDNRDYAAATPLLEAAARAASDNHGVFMDLGIAYRGMDRPQDAKRAWEKALEIDSDDPAPRFNLGILLGDDLKEYDAALEAFTTYIDQGGDQTERAQAYIKKVEREAASAERRRKAEAERAKRQAAREERQRMLQEAEKKFDEQGADESDSQGSTGDEASPWGPVDDSQGGGQ